MELIQGFFYLLLITLLGLLIAFSPMIVIVNVLVVLKSTRPILRTLILMAGMATPLILVAALATVFLHPDSEISLRGLGDTINIPPIFDLALGLWLLNLAWRRRQYSLAHHGPKKSVNLVMKKPPDQLKGLFAFAFVKSALSITNLFAILVLCKFVITHSIEQPLSTIIVLWAILIGLVPFVVILYFYFFKHDRLETLSKQVDQLLNRNLDKAINLALATGGAAFAVYGLINILGN